MQIHINPKCINIYYTCKMFRIIPGLHQIFKKETQATIIWKWKWKSLSCVTLCDPCGLYSPWNSPGQNTGWVAFPFSRGSSQPRDWTQVSCIAGGFFTSWATREVLCFLYTAKKIINKTKLTDWGKIFANDVINKGLISKIYKQLI